MCCEQNSGLLLEWNSQVEADPKTRPGGAAPEPLPPLTLCAWFGNKPQLLPRARSKFDNADLRQAWTLTMEQHDLEYGCGPATGAITVAGSVAAQSAGPDWRAPPPLQTARGLNRLMPVEPETTWVCQACKCRAPAKRQALGVPIANPEGGGG